MLVKISLRYLSDSLRCIFLFTLFHFFCFFSIFQFSHFPFISTPIKFIIAINSIFFFAFYVSSFIFNFYYNFLATTLTRWMRIIYSSNKTEQKLWYKTEQSFFDFVLFFFLVSFRLLFFFTTNKHNDTKQLSNRMQWINMHLWF